MSNSIYINGVEQTCDDTFTLTGSPDMAISGVSPITSAQLAQSFHNLNSSISISPSWSNDTINLGISSHHHSIKKFEMYEAPIDVLALSCALQRMRNNKEYGFQILDKKVVENVTTTDKEKAAAIRDYYSKKVMFGKLSEKLSMTPFRQDMNRFVHTDGLIFKEKDIGMICYLPTFYDYDVNLDEVRLQVTPNQGFTRMDNNGAPKNLGTVVNLTPLKTIVRKTRSTATIQYWMVDDKLNAGVMLSLAKDNPLQHVWDHIFNTEKVLQISGNFSRQTNDDFEYFRVTNWKLTQA